MKTAPRRQKGGYFPLSPDAPTPLRMVLSYRVRFSDVDPMGILWHGRYTKLFELANEEIGRVCGMSYPEFRRDRIAAPIVQLHVDYFSAIKLGEDIRVEGSLLWSEGARMDIEYAVRHADASLAATGYTVQMFVDDLGEPLLASPPMLEMCRKRWLAGDFAELQQ